MSMGKESQPRAISELEEPEELDVKTFKARKQVHLNVCFFKKWQLWDFPVVLWLRLCAPNAGGLG